MSLKNKLLISILGYGLMSAILLLSQNIDAATAKKIIQKKDSMQTVYQVRRFTPATAVTDFFIYESNGAACTVEVSGKTLTLKTSKCAQINKLIQISAKEKVHLSDEIQSDNNDRQYYEIAVRFSQKTAYEIVLQSDYVRSCNAKQKCTDPIGVSDHKIIHLIKKEMK